MKSTSKQAKTPAKNNGVQSCVIPRFSKFECVKFKVGKRWFYGWIANVDEEGWYEVDYGTKDDYEKCLRGNLHTLDMFADITEEELISLGRTRFEK